MLPNFLLGPKLAQSLAPDLVGSSPGDSWWTFKAEAWDLHGDESRGRDQRAHDGPRNMTCTGFGIVVSENAKGLDLGSNPGPPSYMPFSLTICASLLVIYIIKKK